MCQLGLGKLVSGSLEFDQWVRSAWVGPRLGRLGLGRVELSWFRGVVTIERWVARL